MDYDHRSRGSHQFYDDGSTVAPGDDYLSQPSVDARERATAYLKGVEAGDKSRNAPRTDPEQIKTAISRNWKLVSSSNTDVYLQLRDFSSDLKSTIFMLADLHFEFDNQRVTSYASMGRHRFQWKHYTLSTPTNSGNGFCNTYICQNAMKTVYQLSENNEGIEEEVRSVQNEQLHVVIRRGDVECERVYERITEDECEFVEKYYKTT